MKPQKPFNLNRTRENPVRLWVGRFFLFSRVYQNPFSSPSNSARFLIALDFEHELGVVVGEIFLFFESTIIIFKSQIKGIKIGKKEVIPQFDGDYFMEEKLPTIEFIKEASL